MNAMLGPQSTCFCCHWLCRHEAKCGGAYQKTPEPAACTGTHKHCPKSPGRNDFAAKLKGSLILGLHIGFQSSVFVLFVHMLITQLVICCNGLG
jgi:hypothetical protein